MHPIYVAHGYRDREAKYFNFFASLMKKSGFIPSIDPPSGDVNSAKLERHLNFTDGLVAILTNRDEGPSLHILYEISMAVRCKKPVLVFVEHDVENRFVPVGVMIKRFSSQSFIRETPDHMHAIKRFRGYIGESQIANYQISEKQKYCVLIGTKTIKPELTDGIKRVLINRGYSVEVFDENKRILPLTGETHSHLRESDLAIALVNSKSSIDNYVIGAVQATLTPTITLSTKKYPLIGNIPWEYQRRIITNKDCDKDVDDVTKQINLFEEDPLDLYSQDYLDKYTDCLSDIDTPGEYSDDTRTTIINEVTMGDKYEAGQVAAQGKYAKAKNVVFNQFVQNNGGQIDLNELASQLEKLRVSMNDEATTPENFIEIGAVADAEVQSKGGDGPKVFEALSKTGKWSMGVAEKIGVGLATAAIKSATGI